MEPTFRWTFGDGTASATERGTTHVYAQPGEYGWEFAGAAGETKCSRTGKIKVSAGTPGTWARVRAYDEFRTPREAAGFSGQTLYWHFRLENGDGTPLTGSQVAVQLKHTGYAPAAGAFRFAMDPGEAGHLIVSAAVSDLRIANTETSGASFAIQAGAGMLTVDGKAYEVVDPPAPFAVGRVRAPIVEKWTLYAEGSAGVGGTLGAKANVAGVKASLSAASLSLKGRGGLGLTLMRDTRQDNLPSLGYSMQRRFSLSLGTELEAPTVGLSLGKGKEAPKAEIGMSGEVLAGPTGTQGVQYRGAASTSGTVIKDEAKLLHAAFSLETLALSGLLKGAYGGALLRAVVDSLVNSKYSQDLLRRSVVSNTSGAAAEGNWTAGAGLKLPEPLAGQKLGVETGWTGALELQSGDEMDPQTGEVSKKAWLTLASGASSSAFGSGRAEEVAGPLEAPVLFGKAGTATTFTQTVDAGGNAKQFEVELRAQDAETTLDFLVYKEQDLRETVVKERFQDFNVLSVLRDTVAPAQFLHGTVLATISNAGSAGSYAVRTIEGAIDEMAAAAKAARGAASGRTSERTVDYSAGRRTKVEGEIGLGAGLKVDLQLKAEASKEKVLSGARRAVVVDGKDWELASHPGDVSTDGMRDVLQAYTEDVFQGLGGLVKAAWDSIVDKKRERIEPAKPTTVTAVDRTTGQPVCAVTAPASAKGGSLEVATVPMARPEAAGGTAAGTLSSVEWRYTTREFAPAQGGKTRQAGSPGRLYLLGNAVDVRIVDANDAPAAQFDAPVRLEFTVNAASLEAIRAQRDRLRDAGVYFKDAAGGVWTQIPVTVLDGGRLAAEGAKPGIYAVGAEVEIRDGDSDEDGLTDAEEDLNGNGILDEGETHPYAWDTDGDGTSDGEERRRGSDPLDGASHPNRPPVLGYIGNRTVEAGQTLKVEARAADADGDALAWTVTGLPDGAKWDEATGTLQWTPKAIGEHRVTFQVSDGVATDAETILVSVAAAPVVKPVVEYFRAEPNPIVPAAGKSTGKTTLAWKVTGPVTAVEVRVGAADGASITGVVNAQGTAETGDWVQDGMVFFLQDATGGDSKGSARTLAQVTLKVLVKHRLTVQVTGPGTVTSSPAGIDCGPSCSAEFNAGAVTLTATPASRFKSWGGACSGTAATCALNLTAAAAVTATFEPEAPAVTLFNLQLSPKSVLTGTAVTGTVTLSGAAPAGGAVVQLVGNHFSALPPESVTVVAGSVSGQFVFTPKGGPPNYAATISASYGGVKKESALLVRAPAKLTDTMSYRRSAVAGEYFAELASVQVRDSDDLQLAGVVVNWLVESGPVTLDAATSTTDEIGLATMRVRAGQQAGQAVIRATVGSLPPVRLTLSVTEPCQYAISPTSIQAPAAGGQYTISVVTGAGCPWSVVRPTQSWISNVLGSQTGPGSVTIYVAANTSSSARSATYQFLSNNPLGQPLPVSGQVLTVSQSGAAPQNCTYTVPSAPIFVSGLAGTGSFNVATQPGCQWTASSLSNWITITGANPQTGPGTVTFSFTTNPSVSTGREGGIAVAGQGVAILQYPGR